jgi:hypothetical protein
VEEVKVEEDGDVWIELRLELKCYQCEGKSRRGGAYISGSIRQERERDSESDGGGPLTVQSCSE